MDDARRALNDLASQLEDDVKIETSQSADGSVLKWTTDLDAGPCAARTTPDGKWVILDIHHH